MSSHVIELWRVCIIFTPNSTETLSPYEQNQLNSIAVPASAWLVTRPSMVNRSGDRCWRDILALHVMDWAWG